MRYSIRVRESFLFILVCCIFIQTAWAQSSSLEEIEDKALKPKPLRFARVYLPSASTIPESAKWYLIESNYFQKTGSYDQNGELTSLQNEDAFSMTDIQGSMFYGYSDNLQFGVGGRARMVSSQSSTAELSNSGFESYFLKINYNFGMLNNWQMAAIGEYRQTTYSNTYGTAAQVPAGEIVLGDDGADISLGGAITYKLSSDHFLNTTILYAIPPSQLSQEMRYDVHSAWAYTRFAMLLGLAGVYSLQTDPFTDDVANRPQTSTGVTSRFNSLNRSWIAPYIGLNVAFEEFSLGFKGAKTVAGSSFDEGIELGMSFSWGTRSSIAVDKKVSSFKEYLIEASVIKVSPRGKFIKIDKGITSDVEKGMTFDIYKSDYFGGNELVVSGVVYDLGADWAVIRIDKQYKNLPLENGMTARGK
jgi:hypothetical protein